MLFNCGIFINFRGKSWIQGKKKKTTSILWEHINSPFHFVTKFVLTEMKSLLWVCLCLMHHCDYFLTQWVAQEPSGILGTTNWRKIINRAQIQDWDSLQNKAHFVIIANIVLYNLYSIRPIMLKYVEIPTEATSRQYATCKREDCVSSRIFVSRLSGEPWRRKQVTLDPRF